MGFQYKEDGSLAKEGNKFAVLRAKCWWQFYTYNMNDYIFSTDDDYKKFWGTDFNGQPYALGDNDVFFDPVRFTKVGSQGLDAALRNTGFVKISVNSDNVYTYTGQSDSGRINAEAVKIAKEFEIFTISYENIKSHQI